MKIAYKIWGSSHTWNAVSIGSDPSGRGPISDTPAVTSHRPDAVLESWLGNQPTTDLTISMAILKPEMKKKSCEIQNCLHIQYSVYFTIILVLHKIFNNSCIPQLVTFQTNIKFFGLPNL